MMTWGLCQLPETQNMGDALGSFYLSCCVPELWLFVMYVMYLAVCGDARRSCFCDLFQIKHSWLTTINVTDYVQHILLPAMWELVRKLSKKHRVLEEWI